MPRNRTGAIETWRSVSEQDGFQRTAPYWASVGGHERAAEELLRGADTSNTMRSGKEYYAWQWRAGFRKW